jgi:hypothetical protein
MKYIHLLLISIIISSIISGADLKRSSSSIKKTFIDWIYRSKTVITIPDHHDISIKLNQNNTLHKKNSSKNDTYKRY